MARTLSDADIAALKEALQPSNCACWIPEAAQKDFNEVWPVLSSFAHSVKTGQKITLSIFVKVLMTVGVIFTLFGLKVFGKGLVETAAPFVKALVGK
jgi:hypothetical protein